mgnify:CR=1 FL=1
MVKKLECNLQERVASFSPETNKERFLLNVNFVIKDLIYEEAFNEAITSVKKFGVKGAIDEIKAKLIAESMSISYLNSDPIQFAKSLLKLQARSVLLDLLEN